MKKVLYSTTALAAAAGMMTLAADNAAAAEKMKLGISGNYKFLVSYASQDGKFEDAVGTYGTTNMWADGEIHFSGNTTLDNGIRVDVVVELESGQSSANAASAVIDESYLKLTGGFGDLRLGSTKNVGFITSKNAFPVYGIIHGYNVDVYKIVAKPGATSSNTADTPGLLTAANSPHTATDVGPSDAMKVFYLTPKIQGFQAGYSYEPSTTNSDNVPLTGGNSVASGGGTSTHNFALTYDGKFGDVGVGVGGDYTIKDGTGSNTVTITNDFNAYSVGAYVDFSGFRVSGSYYNQSDNRTGSAVGDIESWSAGVWYRTGPWSVGGSYATANSPGSATVTGDNETNIGSVGAKYTLGPGVQVGANVVMAEYNNEATTASLNNEGWGVVAGINVAF